MAESILLQNYSRAQRDAKIISLICEGESQAAVGRLFGVSGQAINYIVRKLGYSFENRTSAKIRGPRFTVPPREKFWSLVDQSGGPDACWEYRGPTWSGKYGTFSIFGERWYAHRLAYYFGHKRPAKNWVCHKCNNPPCCNPNHLYDGTPKQNSADRVLNGTSPRGRIAPVDARSRTVTYKAVAFIEANRGVISAKEMARQLGVSANTVRSVIHGRHSLVRLREAANSALLNQ